MLYDDTVVKIGDSWGFGLEIVFERARQSSIGIGRVLDAAEIAEPLPRNARISRVGLFFDIEEIPRLIAVLNEIYKLQYEGALSEIQTDEEAITGDNDDRVAGLRAYAVFADTLSDFAEKLGLLTVSD